MVYKYKRKETILPRRWSDFLSECCCCFFLWEKFRTVARGRIMCPWYEPDVDYPCDIVCRVVPVCSIWCMFLGLCRNHECLPLGNWCLWRGHWLESLCTERNHLCTTYQWSLLSLGITMPHTSPCKILIQESGCLTLCVRNQGVLPQRKIFRISAIWFSFKMLLLFCDFIPSPCSLGHCPILMGTITVLRWWQPISVPVTGVCLSAIESLLDSWTCSYVSWMLGSSFARQMWLLLCVILRRFL